MTTVSSTNSTNSTGTSGTSSTASSNTTLGLNDFISLLTTELNNQDPTQPQDNTQMIAQMAQFSTLSATTTMSDTLSGISDKLDSILAAQQASASASSGSSSSSSSSSDSSSSGSASA